jgi:hypothetical protein
MGFKLKLILVLLVGIALSSSLYFTSGYFKRQMASYVGYSEICVDGVKYLQFVSGASVKYNVEGKIVRCQP